MIKIFWLVISALAVAWTVTGCMTGQDKTTLDLIAGSTMPYTEAYIEYRGPPDRWAGPANWILHVSSKDAQNPEITVPDAWKAADTVTARKPASQTTTSEESRAKIGALASAMEEEDSGYQGCLYPIHVRLIRADGFVLDKQGCRGQSHWAKAASETVDYFMIAAGK